MSTVFLQQSSAPVPLRLRATADISGSLRVHEQGDDQAVETEHLCENEDEDHADEEAGLLGCSADAGVADDADGEAGCETGEADREPGTELDEGGEEGDFLLQVVGD